VKLGQIRCCALHSAQLSLAAVEKKPTRQSVALVYYSVRVRDVRCNTIRGTQYKPLNFKHAGKLAVTTSTLFDVKVTTDFRSYRFLSAIVNVGGIR